ncbi:MAG: hypothetical protein PHF54_03220, partial [Candidatus Pacebacteria bacterium]|nr:hypothetical protein [Candidatus Paceibacterota bacterium]
NRISSAARCDHFDTLPRFISNISPPKKERIDGENERNYSVLRTREALQYQGYFEGGYRHADMISRHKKRGKRAHNLT